MYTIKDVLRRASTVNGKAIATISATETVSWSAFLERVQAMAGALVGCGLQQGDRVAILALNSVRHFEMMYAVLWVGGVVVPLNHRFAKREIIHCLQDLDGVWIGVDQSCLPLVEESMPHLDGVRGLFYLGADACPPGYVGYDELRRGNRLDAQYEPSVDDLAMIYFTGGTTGVSKGVMLTHGQVLAAAQQTGAGIRSIHAADIYLHVAPMFHVGDGVMCFVSAMKTCGNAFIDRYELKRFIDICNRDKVTWATMVPTMVRSLCVHINESGDHIPSLRGIIYGGSPMPAAVLELAMGTFPYIEFWQGYGTTEAQSITLLEAKFHTLDERGRRIMRSAGRPFHAVLIGILDENDKLLPFGKVGEICIRSNAVMKGYWRKPEMTRKALRDNWYHTGDAGYQDEEGFIYLVDRVKDMIITGGENVYSSEVENVLFTHPDIAEAAVIGLPHEKWGEAVHAVVLCKKGREVRDEDLSLYCRDYLAGYKVPKSYTFVNEPLPKTSVGKVRKETLRESFSIG